MPLITSLAAGGEIIDAYSILSGTSLNCAGGAAPWGTWLSCEEKDDGRVWECDPLGNTAAVVRPALGVFEHEAVAIDLGSQIAYLTEDVGDGGFYRFVADATVDGHADLSAGELQVAEVIDGDPGGTVEWRTVPDPSASSTPTRQQVASSTAFDGGEGIWYQDGVIYFSIEGDNRIWAYEVRGSNLSILYDAATSSMPILTRVDNLTVSPAGDVLVAEDGANMEIVAISADGSIGPILQVTGQDDSEITGPAFGPSFDRLYFSSQRGTSGFTKDLRVVDRGPLAYTWSSLAHYGLRAALSRRVDRNASQVSAEYDGQVPSDLWKRDLSLEELIFGDDQQEKWISVNGKLRRGTTRECRRYLLNRLETRVLELLPEGRGTVVEFGCGTGRNLFYLAQAMPELTLIGIELTPKTVEYARGVAKENGLGVMFLRGDMTAPPTLDTEVDVAYSVHSLG